MVDSHAFLDASARAAIRVIARVLFISSVLAVVLSLVSLAFMPQIGVMVILINGIAVSLGSGLTLLLAKRSLWQVILPLVGCIAFVEVTTSIFLPELKVVVIPFLGVVVLLASLSNNRSYTRIMMVACVVLAALLLGITWPLPVSILLGNLLVPVEIVVVDALVVVIWLVADRLIDTQNTALSMADQRASEAEAARAQAEDARLEIEQRAAEQRRLLDLVQTLELPVMPVDDDVLVAPLVGNLDSRRILALREEILVAVAQQRARIVILDVTGITLIDTMVARALMDTAQAIRLLGAETMISGIRASVAQTLSGLNIDIAQLRPMPNLGAALELARTTRVVK